MLLKLSRTVPLKKLISSKSFSTSAKNNVKVTVLGASGGIGQPLCLLLKQLPSITQLSLYDVLHSPGVAADLNHINTPTVVKGFGPGELGNALQDADFVLVAAGVPRKAGQTMQDQFVATSRIMKDLAVACARENPKAIYGLISHPIISSVPLFCEMFQKANVYDPKKVFGVTTLGVIRANTFIAQEKNLNPSEVHCPVVGGHAGITIVPVVSQCKPGVDLSTERLKMLTKRIREASAEIFEAKFGTGSVTLSMAYAGAQFTTNMVKALKGEKNIVETVYVRSDVVSGAKYFSNQVVLGTNGVEKNLGIGKLNQYEQELLEAAIPELNRSIDAGEDFAAQKV